MLLTVAVLKASMHESCGKHLFLFSAGNVVWHGEDEVDGTWGKEKTQQSLPQYYNLGPNSQPPMLVKAQRHKLLGL